MKLRVPAGCGAISHLGRSLDISEDNSVEVNDDELSALLAHGFRRWEEVEEAPEAAVTSREALIGAAMAATLKTLQSMDAEAIRAWLNAANAASAPVGAGAVAASVNADAQRIATLNRQGLFAFLKGRGVRVALPVTNEALRALARQAIGAS